MQIRAIIAGAALLAVAWEPLAAQNTAAGFEPDPRSGITQVGTRGANFLKIGPSARARAMADAGTSLTGDATAFFYNPSASALAAGFEVAATYTDLYAGSGLTHSYLGVTLPVGQGAFMANAVMFSSGDMPATTEWSPQGFDPIRGEFVEWSAVAIGFGYSRRITDRLALGALGKFAQEGIDFANADYMALDVGANFETGLYGLRLSMAVTNIGGTSNFEGAGIHTEIESSGTRIFNDKILGSDLNLRYATDPLELPTTFRFALQAPLLGPATAVLGNMGPAHSLHAVSEITDGFDTAIESRFGLEYAFNNMAFVRAGKYFQNENRAPWGFSDGLSAGAGVKLPVFGRTLGVDYAYTSMGILENVQTFSFQFGS